MEVAGHTVIVKPSFTRASRIFNRFHNILRLFDVLANFGFTTNETMCSYYLETWYIRVTSQVAERLKN